jgi:hypothetical protein
LDVSHVQKSRELATAYLTHASQAFDAAQAARLGYEELQHRLDRRRVRTVGLAAGLLALTLVGAGLALLDANELSVVLGPVRPVLPALAAAAVWLAGSWVAALLPGSADGACASRLAPGASCSGCYWPRCAASVIRTSCSALWSACSFSA